LSRRDRHAIASLLFGTVQGDICCLKHSLSSQTMFGKASYTNRKRNYTQPLLTMRHFQVLHSFPQLLCSLLEYI
jgi:hypothetical protein